MEANKNKTYSLIFENKIKTGVDISIVKEKLTKFFNNNSDLVEQLFSRETTILKRNLTKTQAEKYKIILEAAGAQCSIVEDIKDISLTKNKKTNIDLIAHKLNDLEKVTRFLVKVISFNQKIMWIILVLSLLSIGMWLNFYLLSPGASSVRLEKTNLSTPQGSSVHQDSLTKPIFLNDWKMLLFNESIRRIEYENGVLHLKITQDDPNIIFSKLPFKPGNKYILHIQIVSSTQSTLQVFYSVDDSQTRHPFSEKNSLRFLVKKGGNDFNIFLMSLTFRSFRMNKISGFLRPVISVQML